MMETCLAIKLTAACGTFKIKGNSCAKIWIKNYMFMSTEFETRLFDGNVLRAAADVQSDEHLIASKVRAWCGCCVGISFRT